MSSPAYSPRAAPHDESSAPTARPCPRPPWGVPRAPSVPSAARDRLRAPAGDPLRAPLRRRLVLGQSIVEGQRKPLVLDRPALPRRRRGSERWPRELGAARVELEAVVAHVAARRRHRPAPPPRHPAYRSDSRRAGSGRRGARAPPSSPRARRPAPASARSARACRRRRRRVPCGRGCAARGSSRAAGSMLLQYGRARGAAPAPRARGHRARRPASSRPSSGSAAESSSCRS